MDSPVSPLAPEKFAAASNVSRETMARLAAYLELLAKWRDTVNLVSRASMADPWRRHMLDSAQLLPLLRNPAAPLLDMGSGAGFPGLVLAIMGAGEVHLVESEIRKCEFLREAARITDTHITIHRARIEDIPPFPVQTVTARACAPLDRLLSWAVPFLANGGDALFLKGATVNKELTAAAKTWTMRVERIPSVADDNGVCLRIEEISLAGANPRAPQNENNP